MSDHLLPSSATTNEIAIANTIARISDVPVPVRDVWNPDVCPANLLPWLAWAYSVDDWGSNWSEAQKRSAVKNSVEVHRHKGTIGAVKQALGALGYSVQLQEWFNQVPEGDPYTFQLLLDTTDFPISETDLQRLFFIVDSTKNLRSHLAAVVPGVTTRAGPRFAAATLMGNEITLNGLEVMQAQLIPGFAASDDLLNQLMNDDFPEILQ